MEAALKRLTELRTISLERYVSVKKPKIKCEEKAKDSEADKNRIRGIIDDPENNIHSSIGETNKRMEKPWK